LSGTVDNYHKKWSARNASSQVPHVKEVVDEMIVKPSVKVSDTDIQKNIQRALESDSRLEKAKFNIQVKDGYVILEGNVHAYYQKIAAEETCRWIVGVVEVKNEIEVSPRERTNDINIKRNIDQLFDETDIINEGSIEVQVENGIVLLRGEVDRIYQRVHAETLTSLVANIAHIRNEINVKTESDLDDL
jgi:osmotically-inducible protein OsmY